jgi:hypothetical protein
LTAAGRPSVTDHTPGEPTVQVWNESAGTDNSREHDSTLTADRCVLCLPDQVFLGEPMRSVGRELGAAVIFYAWTWPKEIAQT